MSLWNRIRPNMFITSPQLRIDMKKIVSKETSFYACHRASFTVEAAVVIPLASAFLVTIIFCFHLLHIQMKVEEAIIYAGRKVAVESSVVTEEVLQLASAKALIEWELGDDAIVDRYVKGGSLGISLSGSDFQGNRIVLRATYTVKIPLNILGLDEIVLWNKDAFQKWVGDLPGEEDGETWVYLTSSGEVYHRLESCRALVIRVKSAFFWTIDALRGKNGQKYYACSRCVENILQNDMVYYTEYGELYHQRLNCGYIKRTIDKKKVSEVENRRPCSLCSGGEEND